MCYRTVRFADSGRVVLSGIQVPNTFIQRAKGLLGREKLGANEGLLLENCSSIHMFGMKFALDIVFLDREWTVVKIVQNLAPWRMSACFKARHVLEMEAGNAARVGLTNGRKLLLCEN